MLLNCFVRYKILLIRVGKIILMESNQTILNSNKSIWFIEFKNLFWFELFKNKGN